MEFIYWQIYCKYAKLFAKFWKVLHRKKSNIIKINILGNPEINGQQCSMVCEDLEKFLRRMLNKVSAENILKEEHKSLLKRQRHISEFCKNLSVVGIPYTVYYKFRFTTIHTTIFSNSLSDLLCQFLFLFNVFFSSILFHRYFPPLCFSAVHYSPLPYFTGEFF